MLPFLQMRIRLMSCVTKVGVETPNMSTGKFLLIHQFRPGHTHELNADAHESDVVDVRRNIRPVRKSRPSNGTFAAWRKSRGEIAAEDCHGR